MGPESDLVWGDGHSYTLLISPENISELFPKRIQNFNWTVFQRMFLRHGTVYFWADF
jgi:hypothetical protein